MQRWLFVLLAAVALAACTNSVTVFRNGDGGAAPSDDDGGDGPSPCTECVAPDECFVATCIGDACVLEVLYGNACSDGTFEGVCGPDGSCVAAECDDSMCDDANPCTSDTCALDTCSYDTAPSGTPCGQNGPVDLMCNNTANCVECLTVADCQHIPASTECATRICQAGGVCGQVFAPAGALLSSMFQVAGDCHQVACDGVGDVKLVVDGSDVPTSSDPCLVGYCTLGTPVLGPLCGPNQQCFGGNCFP